LAGNGGILKRTYTGYEERETFLMIIWPIFGQF